MTHETKRSISLSLYPSTKKRLAEYKEKRKSNFDDIINALLDMAEERHNGKPSNNDRTTGDD